MSRLLSVKLKAKDVFNGEMRNLSKNLILLDYALRYIQQIEIAAARGFIDQPTATEEILRIHRRAMKGGL